MNLTCRRSDCTFFVGSADYLNQNRSPRAKRARPRAVLSLRITRYMFAASTSKASSIGRCIPLMAEFRSASMASRGCRQICSAMSSAE